MTKNTFKDRISYAHEKGLELGFHLASQHFSNARYSSTEELLALLIREKEAHKPLPKIIELANEILESKRQ